MNATFVGAGLNSTYLQNAEFNRDSCPGGYCGAANLSNAYLKYADMPDANLQYVDLTDADLRNTDLTNANLEYADLTDAAFMDHLLPT